MHLLLGPQPLLKRCGTCAVLVTYVILTPKPDERFDVLEHSTRPPAQKSALPLHVRRPLPPK
jgi:hypothetical protein